MTSLHKSTVVSGFIQDTKTVSRTPDFLSFKFAKHADVCPQVCPSIVVRWLLHTSKSKDKKLGWTLVTKFSFFKTGNPFPEALQLISPYASWSRTQPPYMTTLTCKVGWESEYLPFTTSVVGEKIFQWEGRGRAWLSGRQPTVFQNHHLPKLYQEHLQLNILPHQK